MKKSSLTRKLTLYPLLVGGLPLIIGLVVIYLTAFTSQRTLVGSNFESLAGETAKEVDLIIEKELKAIRTMASDPEIHALSVAQSENTGLSEETRRRNVNTTTEHFINFVSDNPRLYKDIILTDKNGDEITSLRGPSKKSYKDEIWWQAAYNHGHGGKYLSDFRFLDDTEQAEIDIATFFTHIVADQGEPPVEPHADGVIRVVLDAGVLLRPTIYGVRIGDTGHAMLVSSDGTPRLCSLEALKDHNLTPGLMKLITRPTPGWAVAKDDGHGSNKAIIGSSPLPIIGSSPLLKTNALSASSLGGEKWYIFIRQAPLETYGPIYTNLGIMLLIGTILVGIFLITGYQIARRLIQPIRVLQAGAETIGRGDLAHRIDIRAGDELEDLAFRFNEMATNLQESQKRRENWNEELEKEVAKRTVELQEAHRKLNQAFIEQKQFISDASHELRTPITIIMGHMELLKETLEQSVGQTEVQTVEVALGELQRMGRLLENMLMLARASQADFLAVEDISVPPFLKEVLTKAEGLADRRWDLQIDTKGQVRADRDRLTQVFLNLIQNSIYHTKKTDTISLTASDKNGGITFSVKDTGTGIPEQELPKIFTRFYRLDKARSREFGQAGLGLSIVDAIVKAHGGKITVQSKLGTGTDFTFWFPSKGQRKP